MTITIPPQLEDHVRDKAQAEGVSIEVYIAQLIRDDEEWIEEPEGPLDEKDPDFAEIQAAVREGLQQAERGESRPAEEVFADLRDRHGIPR